MTKHIWSIFTVTALTLFFAFSVAANLLTPTSQNPAQYTRITHSSGEPTRQSQYPDINSDGTKIVFGSNSDLLNEGIGPDKTELWLYDTTSMTLTRITSPTHNSRNQDPAINSDGSKIVFESNVDLINGGSATGPSQIWLYDTTSMTYTRITTSTNRSSYNPEINSDGSRIVFDSYADLLNEGLDIYYAQQIWLYDTSTMTYTRVTTSTNRYSIKPDINSDGSKIVFESDADLLNEGLNSSQYQIWLYDTTTTNLIRLTNSSDTNRDSTDPAISGDGTKIVFDSDSDLLGEGIEDNQYQIWLYDTSSMTLTRITDPIDPTRDSFDPAINSDGSKITFTSDADLRNEGLEDNQHIIWLYDTTTMTFTHSVTSPVDIHHGNYTSAINSDGSKVAFASTIDLFNEGFPNYYYQYQVWLWDTLALRPLSVTHSVHDPTLTFAWDSGGLTNCHYHLYRSSAPYTGFDTISSDMSGLSTDTLLTTAESPISNSYYYIRTTGCDGGQEAISATFSEFGFILYSGE